MKTFIKNHKILSIVAALIGIFILYLGLGVFLIIQEESDFKNYAKELVNSKYCGESVYLTEKAYSVMKDSYIKNQLAYNQLQNAFQCEGGEHKEVRSNFYSTTWIRGVDNDNNKQFAIKGFFNEQNMLVGGVAYSITPNNEPTIIDSFGTTK